MCVGCGSVVSTLFNKSGMLKNIFRCMRVENVRKIIGKLAVIGINSAVVAAWLGLCFTVSLSGFEGWQPAHQHYFTCFLTSPAAYRAACLLPIYIKKKKKRADVHC